MPSTTLYRRLDGLVDVGLLEEHMRLDGDGDHYHVYRTTLDGLHIVRDDGGLAADIEVDADGTAQPPPGDSRRIPRE